MPRKTDDRSKYRKDFPFIDKVPTTVCPGPLNREGWEGFSGVTVQVKLADRQLMYREPEDAGPWSDARWESVSLTRPPHYKGKKGEYVYVVTTDGELSDPYAPSGLRIYTSANKSYRYLRDVFKDYDFSKAAYILLVTTVAWYDLEPSASWGAEGGHDRDKFVNREMQIMVYKPPKQGWADLYRNSKLSDSYLTTKRVIKGVVRNDPAWLAISDRLQDLANEFESGVYQMGMRKKINASKMSGMASQWGNVKVMTYVSIGRVMITLEDPKFQVTFIASEEGEPRMGWQSVEGPLPQIERVVRTVIKSWGSTPNPASQHKNERGFRPWPGIGA